LIGIGPSCQQPMELRHGQVPVTTWQLAATSWGPASQNDGGNGDDVDDGEGMDLDSVTDMEGAGDGARSGVVGLGSGQVGVGRQADQTRPWTASVLWRTQVLTINGHRRHRRV
jgi:hypothetical protein